MYPQPPRPPLFPYTTLFRSIDITAGDDYTLQRVVARECARNDTICAKQVQGEAFSLGSMAEMQKTEEHTSELQSLTNLVCRLLLEKKKKKKRLTVCRKTQDI